MVHLLVAFPHLFLKFRVNQPFVKILPDRPLFIFTTVKSPARHRPVVIGGTTVIVSVQMHTITVFIMANEVRPAKFPTDYSLINVLAGQGERDLATDSLAVLQTTRTIDVRIFIKRVFVFLGVLKQKPYAALLKFFYQPLCHCLFPLIDFLN